MLDFEDRFRIFLSELHVLFFPPLFVIRLKSFLSKAFLLHRIPRAGDTAAFLCAFRKIPWILLLYWRFKTRHGDWINVKLTSDRWRADIKLGRTSPNPLCLALFLPSLARDHKSISAADKSACPAGQHSPGSSSPKYCLAWESHLDKWSE